MKLIIQIILILIIFFKTETLLSENNLFNVNNIQLEKKDKISNNALADQAIKTGFSQLITKILLKEDGDKLKDLDFSSIKQLVSYYQITKPSEERENQERNTKYNAFSCKHYISSPSYCINCTFLTSVLIIKF